MAVSMGTFVVNESFQCMRGCQLGRGHSVNVYQCFQRSSCVKEVYAHPNWLVLQTPSISTEEIAVLRQRVKYLAVLPNTEGAVVLVDDGRGLLQPQAAFYVSENVIFVFDGAIQVAKSVRMVLYRNPKCVFACSEGGITFSTIDMASYLFMGENFILKKMLQYDECYTVVDRFMLSAAFIYLRRANLSEYFYTNIVVILAALLLAHNMEEDEGPGRSFVQLIYNSLPHGASVNERLKFVSACINFQTTLFQKILYRGYVRVEECEEVISTAPNHPFWKRWRLSFHGGAVRNAQHAWKLQFIHTSIIATIPDLITNNPGLGSKCIICRGNSSYSPGVRDRFNFCFHFESQKMHLTSVLTATSEVHQLNRKLLLSCPDFVHHFMNCPATFSTLTEVDRHWPTEYVQLLEIENEIENVLANEKYLQKFVAMLQKRKLIDERCA